MHPVIPVETTLQETLVDGVQVDDEEVVHLVHQVCCCRRRSAPAGRLYIQPRAQALGKPSCYGPATVPVFGEPQLVRATMPSISEAEKARMVLERMFPAALTLSKAATADSSSG